MTIRVDILEDLTIEIMRIDEGQPKFLIYKDLDTAIIIFRYLLKRDLEKAGSRRFVPRAEVEALYQEELLQSNELNADILGSISEGVVVFNDSLKCIQWNDSMEEIAGIKKEEVLGKTISEIFGVSHTAISRYIHET